LELEPKSEATSASYFKNANDFNTALLVVYDNLQGQVNDYFELIEYRSDNLFLSAPTAGTQDRYNLDHFVETTANQLVLDFWRTSYQCISRTNDIISRIDDVKFDEDLKTRYKAEAQFLRAYNYLNLVRLWGNVPLVLSPLGPDDALKTGREQSSKVYEAIIADLTYAVDNLPDQNENADLGRVTSHAARALRAKTNLTLSNWDIASYDLYQIIASNQFQLLDDISNVFNVQQEFNNEVIFAIRFNKEIVGEGHGRWFATPDTITSNPTTPALLAAYQVGDARRKVIAFTKSGTTFVLNKFFDEQSGVTNTVGNDYILLRYADIILMQAEALNEVGYVPNGQAFSLLNAVRNRAGLPSLNSANLISQEEFREAVLHERWLEFPFEAQRWFDLIRTGSASEQVTLHQGISMQSHQYLYPIPQTEIEKMNNSSIFPQNPGY
jgi:hypothetical protein